MSTKISSTAIKNFIDENNFDTCVGQISTLTRQLGVLAESMKSLIDEFPMELIALFDLGVAVSVVSAGSPDVIYIAGETSHVRDALNNVEQQLQSAAAKRITGETDEETKDN